MTDAQVGDTLLDMVRHGLLDDLEARLRQLEVVDVTWKQVTEEEVVLLVGAIAKSKRVGSVKRLFLDGNKALADRTCSNLAKFIQAYPALEELRLSHTSVTDAGIVSLAQAIPGSGLIGLHLSDVSQLTSVGIRALAECLSLSETELQDLDLSTNRLDDESLSILSEGLKKNIKVSGLDLSANRFTVDGVRALGEYAKESYALSRLVLARNPYVYDDSCEVLAALLAKNHSLSHLDISECQIGDDGMRHLAKWIPLASTVVSLNVSRSGVTLEGYKALRDALEHNESIQTCTLDDEVFDDRVRSEIGDFVARNERRWRSLMQEGMEDVWKTVADLRELSEARRVMARRELAAVLEAKLGQPLE